MYSMMSYLLHLSIIIILSTNFCLTQDFDELIICSTQTQIRAKHAFRYQNKFVAFVKLNRSETVNVIKVNGFDPLVSDNGFELRSSSVDLWLDWDMNTNDMYKYDELKNFEDVFVREDSYDHYVVFLKSGHYYRAKYDNTFRRVEQFLDREIANSGDTLQIEIDRLFRDRNDRYLTSMRFPEERDLPKRAFVYLKTQTVNVFDYNVNVLTLKQVIRANGNEEWVTSSETIPYDRNIVSAFYITNYTSVETNRKQFYMIEISLNGGFKVKKISFSTQTSTNDTTQEDISDVYSGDMRQLFQCPVMPTTLLSTTTTTELSNVIANDTSIETMTYTSITPSTASTISSSQISSITPQQTTPETTVSSTHTTSHSLSPNGSSMNTLSTIMSTVTDGTQSKNKTWIYIIAAIILLLIIAAIILLIWCCCCRTKQQSENEENGQQENGVDSKSIPEDEDMDTVDRIIYSNPDDASLRSVPDDDLSDTSNGNQSQTEIPEKPSVVSPQTQSPKDDTKVLLKKKSVNKDYDETAAYSIDGIKRYK